MSWQDLHTQSERLAIAAEEETRLRNGPRAKALYKAAAEAERSALDHLDLSKARTRGITAVSAVALWYKAAEYAMAEQLAYAMLAESHMPEFARAELRTLVQAIWTESARQEAAVDFVAGEVIVAVKGGEVVTGGAPLDLIVEKVQTIQSMFYRTIEFVTGRPHRRAGRPPREIQEACRPWLFQAAPGSYQFAVAIQKPQQPDFFQPDIEPERIAQHFLEIVSASTASESAALSNLVPDDKYRSTFLKLARNLAPSGRTFDRIELRLSGDANSVALIADSRSEINSRLRKENPIPLQVDETQMELQGILRAVHLDKDWLEVVVDGESKRIEGLEDALDDVIGPMVNKPVLVRVIRGSGARFTFVDIELAD